MRTTVGSQPKCSAMPEATPAILPLRDRISLPVLTETGVITPGQFVRYRTSPSSTQTGIVRGTAIDWQRPRLRQTLEIEAHEFV